MPQARTHGEKGGSPLKTERCMLLALGANLTSSVGAPEMTFREALKVLEMEGASIRAVSPFYNTPAFPVGNGPDYLNAAASIRAPWTAAQTLAVCHRIEARMGRERLSRWGQRTLDLDLIALEDQVLPDARTHARWRGLALNDQMTQVPDQPVVPHPRMQDRAFVLVPLADVAPDWVHPVLEKTVTEMRDALDRAALAQVRLMQV